MHIYEKNVEKLKFDYNKSTMDTCYMYYSNIFNFTHESRLNIWNLNLYKL